MKQLLLGFITFGKEIQLCLCEIISEYGRIYQDDTQ